MKLANLVRVIVFLVVSFGSLFSQQSRIESRASGQVRVVEFGKDIKIHETAATKKYIAIMAGPEGRKGEMIQVYDRSGNSVFQNRLGDDGMTDGVLLSDSLGYVIRINSRYAAYEHREFFATAFDIKTGHQVWRSRLPRYEYGDYDYRVSPDGLFMINGGDDAPYPIVNLQRGDLVKTEDFTGNHRVGADWLDNQKIVVAIEQSRPNPAAVPLIKRAQERRAKIDSLVYLIDRTIWTFEKGAITKEKMETDTAGQLTVLRALRKEDARDRRSHTPRTLPSAARLVVYDIQSGKVEIETEIYTPEKEPVEVSAALGGQVGVVNVERPAGNIYVYAQTVPRKSNTRCLLRLNRRLGTNMSTTFALCPVFRLNAGNEVHFAIHKENATYLLDRVTWKFFRAESLETGHGTFALDLDSLRLTTRRFVRGVQVGSRTRIIEFTISKKRQQ